jgi:hypothetical protein
VDPVWVEEVVMRSSFAMLAAFALALVACSESESGDQAIEWAASTAAVKQDPDKIGYGITHNTTASPDFEWLTEVDDYKPVYSADGTQVAFFRVFDYGDGRIPSYKTKICVMDADGSNVRELTVGEHADFNPYWTRDGTNQITFTRFTIPFSQKIYRISPDGEPGDEVLISRPEPDYFEFGYSSLEDGRMLIRRDFPRLGYHLMTPNPGGMPTYEPISHPGDEQTYMHKMTISRDETKVAYMKIEDITPADIIAQRVYWGSAIAYADFDADSLGISNEVDTGAPEPARWNGYPHWDADGETVLYTNFGTCAPLVTPPECVRSGVVMAYSLRAGEHTQISTHDDLVYGYVAAVGVVK